jgi:hypothetical protein
MGLGSGKNLFRIADPWVKKAPDPGFGSATLLSNKAKLSVINNINCPDNVLSKIFSHISLFK